jgi:hypothetical protein
MTEPVFRKVDVNLSLRMFMIRCARLPITPKTIRRFAAREPFAVRVS